MSEIHRSEVTRFREQQTLEEEAAKLALSGFAITARHDFITARVQRGGACILQLIAEGKHDEAQVLMNSENWGAEEAEVIGVERENNGQTQSEPSAHVGT